MSHRNPSDQELKQLLTRARTIAMIGAYWTVTRLFVFQ